MSLKNKFGKTMGVAGLSSLLLLSTCDKAPTESKNNPPEIVSTPVLKVNENQKYEYQVQAEDPDGDKLNYNIVGHVGPNSAFNPDWLSISKDGLVSGTAPEVSQDFFYDAQIQVSDGEYFTEQKYNVTIKNRD